MFPALAGRFFTTIREALNMGFYVIAYDTEGWLTWAEVGLDL